MAVIFKASDFVTKVKDIATKYKTVYCWGSFGFPITQYNIDRLASGYPSIYTISEKTKLKGLIGKNYFGFDCVGLIKGVLWGFTGDRNSANGGSVYASHGVNDIDCNAMFNMCSDKSTDFSDIVEGEFVWKQGHIGVYVGGGLVCEASPAFKGGVQITALGNIGTKTGYSTRKWTMHGKSPFIDYGAKSNDGQIPSNSAHTNISTVTDCKNVYISEGIAALRSSASTLGALRGRCNRKDYYVACQIVKPAGNKQTWFKHANSGLYSAIDDTNGAKLFSLYGTYTEGKTNAPVKIRTEAGLHGIEVGRLAKGATVYMTGKTANGNGLTWCQIVYGGKLCWCDRQWIT